jgi:hypothetical protein
MTSASVKDFNMGSLANILGRCAAATLFTPLAFILMASTTDAVSAAEPVNLALKKPAYVSSIENDEHNAAQANDGDLETCWRADDEPEGGPEWWLVDLGKAFDLSGCQIVWPFDRMKYQFKVEGSEDRKAWVMLSDQIQTTSKTQIRDLKFEKAEQIRYVRITITALEEGCWASIAEVKVFGTP